MVQRHGRAAGRCAGGVPGRRGAHHEAPRGAWEGTTRGRQEQRSGPMRALSRHRAEAEAGALSAGRRRRVVRASMYFACHAAMSSRVGFSIFGSLSGGPTTAGGAGGDGRGRRAAAFESGFLRGKGRNAAGAAPCPRTGCAGGCGWVEWRRTHGQLDVRIWHVRRKPPHPEERHRGHLLRPAMGRSRGVGRGEKTPGVSSDRDCRPAGNCEIGASPAGRGSSPPTPLPTSPARGEPPGSSSNTTRLEAVQREAEGEEPREGLERLLLAEAEGRADGVAGLEGELDEPLGRGWVGCG